MTEDLERPIRGNGANPLVLDQPTSWALIERAAEGSAAARADFCRRYLPVVRCYLASRWRASPVARHVDDAEQEVFLRCLREGGLLERADPGRDGGFQGFLYGLTRNVAREFEARDARSGLRHGSSPPEVHELPSREDELTVLFDRAFAHAVVGEAAELMRARAEAAGQRARRRVELLRLRFEGGLAMHAIAARWGERPDRLQDEYGRARRDFRRALQDAAARHLPGRTPGAVRAYCERLLELIV